MVLNVASKTFTKVFGSRNERLIKYYKRGVERINALEPQVRKLTDEQLREKTAEFRRRFNDGESIASLNPEVLAVAREIMDRAVGIRNIFNPEAGFDPNTLPENLRPVYQSTAEKMAATDPIDVLGGHEPIPGWRQVPIPNEIYDAVRELHPRSRPPFRARPFDVQLTGGQVLSEGKIAEMKTGEGKTIVAPLACYLACVEGMRSYVVTVNDYLVQRDRDWVSPFYLHAGLSVGAIHPYHVQPPQMKQRAYQCDVVYGTNSEFGFDYLRDNMKMSTAEQVQSRRDFCIIDEVDSILIDEARTPLIISGPAHSEAPRYDLADRIARHLIQKQREWDAADEKFQNTQFRAKGLEGDIRNSRDKAKSAAMRDEMKALQDQLPGLEAARDEFTQYYEVEREKKSAHLTHEGIAEAQKVANIGSFYVDANMDFPHLLENALRAHVVYHKDKEYVVQQNDVIIVDEFTGRLMVGRQWSDGLHQAVEAKEKVTIKQETQTLATVTIQNFFKLFKRLAGMTGTAITEATEFDEIYNLDVVCIPTNVPVVRADHEDLIFLSEKDKWNAILDHIKAVHDIGRPVLVGTTSVEKSEKLSQMLKKRHGIRHEVLNAKQHEREAHIVENAGTLGAVMIATNMAGRGTDIKLGRIDRAALVRHWQARNILSKQAKPDMTDDELVALAYRHIAAFTLGIKPKEVEQLADDEIRLRLLRHWVEAETYLEPKKIDKMSVQQLQSTLDQVPAFEWHRLCVWDGIEQMGGLHIVGTERHEARRIDNQLRGRSGRQGDKGSSRFFISLEDDLMKMFAGKTTMAALSKLGMKEGDAIEHRWITKSVERAQRKVEERNYEIRKNLLEYDELMERQRHDFYHIRQDVLEGKNIQGLIFDYIGDAVDDAIRTYLDPDYVPIQVAEWSRQNLDVSLEPDKLKLHDLGELQAMIRKEARAEVEQIINVTVGEYMSNDVAPEDWDLRGLAQWAMSRFSVDLKQNRLRQMNIDEVKALIGDTAAEHTKHKDLTGVAKFLDPQYAQKDLAEWARNKFGIEADVEKLAGKEHEKVADYLLSLAREAYDHREMSYPLEFVIEMVFQAAQQDGAWAAEQLAGWANQRYEMGWSAETVAKTPRAELYEQLRVESEAWWRGGKLEALVDRAMAEHADPAALAKWASERFFQPMAGEDLAALDDAGRRTAVLAKGRALLRSELTQLERYVLLQILDHSWKDHLYAIDQLRDSVGLRGFAEQDPRLEFKREGTRLMGQMHRVVRDRVTDLIFRAKRTANAEATSVYTQQSAKHQAPQALPADTASPSSGAEPSDSGGGRPRRKPQGGKRPTEAEARKSNQTQVKQRKRKSR